MTVPSPGDPLLTLEPLLDAVRAGVEASGWELSGLQKTTSYEFEGRWEGESTRSAYLFFHHPDRWAAASVEGYLDETSRGLRGNLQLVLDGPPLRALGDPEAALASVAAAAGGRLPQGSVVPVTLRLRLPRAGAPAADADVEWRVKLRLAPTAMEGGQEEVTALAAGTVEAFEALLEDPGLRAHARPD